MYARVVTFEGGTPEAIDQAAAQIRSEAVSGPPEGVPAKQFLLLNDKGSGRSLVIMLFETEADYAQGDATLNEMSPPGEGMGQRVSVDKYEVGAKLDA
jgi:hypothetical protein